MEYLIQMRLKRACELLETTDAAVKDIAREVGYQDPCYFGRAFRCQHGASPGEYREAHR